MDLAQESRQFQIGTDKTERLVDGVLAIGLDKKRIEMFLCPMEGEMGYPAFALAGSVLRYLSDNRQGATVLYVLLAVNGVVKAFPQEEDGHGQEEGSNEG